MKVGSGSETVNLHNWVGQYIAEVSTGFRSQEKTPVEGKIVREMFSVLILR